MGKSKKTKPIKPLTPILEESKKSDVKIVEARYDLDDREVVILP